MSKESIILICLFIVVTFIIVIVLLRFQKSMITLVNENEKNRIKESSELREKVNNDLLNFQNTINASMKDDFNRLNETTVNRLVTIEEKVNTSMQKGFNATYESFSKIMEQMARIDTTQKNLENLSSSITTLQSVLTDKKNRGTFGEVELYSILENQFGVNNQRYERQYKLSNDKIVDAVIHAPEPLGLICIDSKFPLENYNRIYNEELSKEEREKAKNAFRNDVVFKIKDIASKYIIPGETAEFAYMFIPAEAVFSEIYGRYDDIVNLSYNYHVYLVSPTNLMAYLTAMRAIYLGQEKNERVADIQQEFIRLGKEFSRFEDRFNKINSDFKKTYNDMQDVSITTNKIIQRFKDIEEVKLDADSSYKIIE